MKVQREAILWCLHGNLQLPQVWKSVEQLLSGSLCLKESLSLKMISENLWQDRSERFWQWAAAFNKKSQGSSSEMPQFIMGYSLGGRLALHAVLHNPANWCGAIIVSAEPGLADEREKVRILQRDRDWASRFRTENWQDLLQEWDAQPVFGGRANSTVRNETDFSRAAIGRIFDTFSKGRQDNLLPALKRLTDPRILYISGEHDQKYCKFGRNLAAHCPTIQHEVVADAAHRVPWESPRDFSSLVCKFIVDILRGQHSDRGVLDRLGSV